MTHIHCFDVLNTFYCPSILLKPFSLMKGKIN
nr:MAG TPA: hypothetical protein [Caudoviricetes sp.]